MKIDAHQHFWHYNDVDYGWIAPDMAVFATTSCRLCGRNRIRSRHRRNGGLRARQTVANTHWLLDLAEAHPWILGVVGWVDLRRDDLDAQLEALAGRPKLGGRPPRDPGQAGRGLRRRSRVRAAWASWPHTS
ncbi:MAG: hypothetical protein R2854_28400 [Caldilineaceae bacterium]